MDSEESSSDDDPISTHRRRFSGQQQQRKDEDVVKTGAITKAHAPLGKAYWANLASAHAHDMSHSGSGIGLDGDASVASVAAVDGYDDQEVMNGGLSSSGTESDNDEDEDEEESGIVSYHVGELDQVSLRQRAQRRRRRTSSQQSTTLKQAIQLQRPNSVPLSPTSISPSHSSALPEHFSAHFIFVSLVLRIWACLSICNPLMVRPLVLYPVLVMTVVWDRYVLSLISERFLRRKKKVSTMSTMGSRQHAQRRGRRVAQNGIDAEEIGLSDQNSTAIADADAAAEGRQEGSVVLKTTHGDNDNNEDADADAIDDMEHDNSIKLIWQALLSGVIVQVAWVGLIWLFSRGRVCAVL